jgi:hypothetical protein
MSLTKRKILKGSKFYIEVPVPAYDDSVKVHAISDDVFSDIEEKTKTSLTEVAANFAEVGLTQKEIDLVQQNKATEEILKKLASIKISHKTTKFMIELCKAGIVPEPDPECPACSGKVIEGTICPECDIRTLIGGSGGLHGYSTIAIGISIIAASQASWKDVENFFLAQKGLSGDELPAIKV